MGFAAALKLGDKDGIFVNRLVVANSFQAPSSSWRVLIFRLHLEIFSLVALVPTNPPMYQFLAFFSS